MRVPSKNDLQRRSISLDLAVLKTCFKYYDILEATKLVVSIA